MKYKLRIIPVFIFTILISSCKKELDKKNCWYLVDLLGYILPNQICDKSENEMNTEYGSQYFFFKASDPRYCWRLKRQPNPDIYVRDLPEYMINKFFPSYTAEIVDCNSFCNWKILLKHRSKITGNYTPNTIKNETIFNINDTCGKLYMGRIVIVSETTDSIHTAEFIEHF